MDFGFQGRGGTAPALSSVGYGRTTRAGRSVAGDPYRYDEQALEGVGDALGLPKAPAFRGQRQGNKGDKKASAKKIHGCHRHQARPSWGKRHTEGNKRNNIDGVGAMLSTLPASRQALSELMDLNLALKYDKMKKHREARQQQQQNRQHTTRSGTRLEGRAAADSPSSSRYSAAFDKKASISARYSPPSERYHAKANHTYGSSAMDVANSLDQAVAVQSEHPGCPTYDTQEQRVRRDGNMHSIPSHTTTGVSPDESLMISPSRYLEVHSSAASPGVRVSAVATLGDQFKAASRARRVAAKSGHQYSRHFVAKRGCDSSGETNLGTSANSYNRPESTCEQDLGIESEDGGEPGQDARLSCHETSSLTSQQSDKDQRMWSALKTTLLSEHESEVQEDPCFVGLRTGRPKHGGVQGGGTQRSREGCTGVSGDGRSYTFLKGTRDLEQLDLERSAMDRTMRPHRVASARLLETNPESPSPSKVKHPRNFSASASRPRTRQNESISSVWLGAGGILQCTGVRAQLVPQHGIGQAGTSDDADVDGYSGLTGEAGNRQGEDSLHQLARKADVGRFQWVTNDEGVANFLQRPPSRQKEAFPTHLADVVPYAAFQKELPIADEEAKHHIEVTRKNAVEQARPSSRHKPPVQSLFLEVPETRRQVPPVLPASQGAVVVSAESCRGLPPGRLSVDGADVKATTVSDALGTVFALDRRHDNPDRDGFSVLQVQGPCPFRIEVTNSFVHPHPPTESVGREAVISANRGGISKTADNSCPPNPTSVLFGTMPYDTGGHTNAGKQRAPINTTPNPGVSCLGSPLQVQGDAVGKGACAVSLRMTGSRSTGGTILSDTGGTADGSARGEGGVTAGDTPSPCARSGFRKSESEVRGVARAPSGTLSGAGEGIMEESARRKADAIAGGGIATGRSDTSALRVNTGATGINESDWSLQSCDDADDGAFLDGPGSALGASAGTKHALLDTTLSQDFLSLFAPSSCRDDGRAASTFDTF